MGILLSEGIGDTIRVSLTAPPWKEVRVGYEILKSLKLRQRGPEIISCPTCGRKEIDVERLVKKVESIIRDIKIPIKIAIMGCPVNGPGEAKYADIGIAGTKNGYGFLFKKGKIVKRVPDKFLIDELLKEIRRYEK